MQGVAILGSTGSVGENTLDVIARHPDRFRVVALGAHRNVEKLAEQCRRFSVPYAAIADESLAPRLREQLRAEGAATRVLAGATGLEELAALPEADSVMAAIVGAAGLRSTLAAARAGKRLLLANKESLVMAGPLLIGLFAGWRRTSRPAVGGVLLLILCAALLVGNRSGLWIFDGAHRALAAAVPPVARPNATNVVLIAMLLAIAAAWMRRQSSQMVTRLTYAATLLLMAASLALTWNLQRPRGFEMADRTNDVLFRVLSEGRGLLLTGGDLHLVQLRSRRPVLLDGGGLDALPYAVESAPEMDRILREVYGVDLLNPPEEARFRGSVPPEFTRTVWQSYTREQWQSLASRFGVRQVLTPGDWDLKLPVAVRNRTLTVYDIPYISP